MAFIAQGMTIHARRGTNEVMPLEKPAELTYESWQTMSNQERQLIAAQIARPLLEGSDMIHYRDDTVLVAFLQTEDAEPVQATRPVHVVNIYQI